MSFENFDPRLSSQPAKPVSVTAHGGDTDTPVTVVLQRKDRETILEGNGLKAQDGRLLPFDTSEKEVACLLRFDENRITGKGAFRPTHYPENLNLYYPGFEADALGAPFPTEGQELKEVRGS